jgi:hypothetical protein
MRCAEDAFDVANLQKLPVQQLRWIYELIIFQFVKRPDKIILGLVIRKESEQQITQKIQQFFQEFSALS